MNIYIDEAGVFVVSSKDKCCVSCVGGLAIPTRQTEAVFAEFAALKESWGIGASEIKGSKLLEPQVSSLISMLRKHDVIFDIIAIDMNAQNNKGLANHRGLQGQSLTKNLTPEHKAGLVEGVHKLKKELEALNLQLYVQAVCTMELLTDLLQTITLYYVQRVPAELGSFQWYVDAKDKEITPYEKLWTMIVLPMQQSRSFQQPLITLEGADYSHFEKFCKADEIAPEHIREHVKRASPFEYVELQGILGKNISFQSSHSNLGIQIVDILTTSIRRAMNGKLGIAGWAEIGRLMVTPLRRKQVLHLVDLCEEGMTPYLGKKSPPFFQVIRVLDGTCRPIIAEEQTEFNKRTLGEAG